MKRIIAIFAAIMLVTALLTVPASAAISPNNWEKMTGPGTIEVNSTGTTVTLDEGFTFYKYTESTFDIKNFSCKLKFEHTAQNFGQYFFTMSNKKAHSGSTGLFLLFHIQDTNYEFMLEGQILNAGLYLEPRSTVLPVDISEDVTMYGKDNGDGSYTVSFEGCEKNFTFHIPENYQFTEDLNGQAYISIGGNMSSSVVEAGNTAKFTVYEINGTSMVLDPNAVTSSNNSSDSDGAIIIGGGDTTSDVDTDTNTNTNTNTDTATDNAASSSNTLLIVIIICATVLVLVAVGVVVAIVVMKKKNGAGVVAADTAVETEAEAEAEAEADETSEDTPEE